MIAKIFISALLIIPTGLIIWRVFNLPRVESRRTSKSGIITLVILTPITYGGGFFVLFGYYFDFLKFASSLVSGVIFGVYVATFLGIFLLKILLEVVFKRGDVTYITDFC